MVKEYDNCSFCGGKVIPQKVKVDYWWKGELTIIENVPAGVCQQCGEEYYEGKIVEDMERLVESKKIIKTIPVKVKDYREAIVV
ncbi:MAG: type II toxin-antitoxin system MqsA family antitoxin [bacterium]